MQIQAKEQNKQLYKAQDNYEASNINQDVQAFEIQQKQKKEEVERQMREHRMSLEKQIGNKGANSLMADHEYQLNKKLIESIEKKNNLSPVSANIRKPF